MNYFCKKIKLYKKFFKRYGPLIVIMTFFSCVVLTSFYVILQPKITLPIYSPSMVSTELVEEEIQHVKKYHKISNFSMINQNADKLIEQKVITEKGVNDLKWNLLTGNKQEIYELARKSYLVAKSNGDGGKYDMIHTENFVLIDKEKRIRGYYDGTNELEMDKLINDLEVLEESYKN